MNKAVLIVVIIAVLGLVGVGGYAMMSKKSVNPDSVSQETTNTQSSKRPPTENLSLKELLAIKEPQQCQFSDTKTNSSGTVYISNEQFRGNFQSKLNSAVVNSHMVVTNNTAYVWSDGQPQGIKMQINTILNPDTTTKDSMKQNTVDLTQTIEYSCSGWNTDASQFAVPTEIEFTDYSEVMQNALNPQNPQGSMQDTKAACAACASLQGQAQAQCKASLGCK